MSMRGDLTTLQYGKGLLEHARNSEERVPAYGSNGVIGFHDKAIRKDEQQLLEDFGRPNESAAIDWQQLDA